MATILVVDDHPVNRQFLTTLLSYGGHRLIEAGDGAEALKQAIAERPDLIISDIAMPTMNGVEFMRRLRADETMSSIPVILYTATYQLGEARILTQGLNPARFIAKPSSPSKILEAVEAALAVVQPAATALSETPASDETAEPDAPGDSQTAVAPQLPDSLGALLAASLRLTALVEFSMAIGATRDSRSLLEISCRASSDIVSARYTALGILNDDGDGLRHFLARGMDASIGQAMLPPILQAGPLHAVMTERQPIRLNDLTGDPRQAGLPPGHVPVRALLVVPLLVQDRVIGWFYFADRLGPVNFSDDDERLAATLANQVALAYDNVLLSQAARDHAAQLERELDTRHQAEQRYRFLYEAMAQGIVYYDASGRVISANPAAQRILGLTGEEIRGLTPHSPQWSRIREDGSVIAPKDYPALQALVSGTVIRDVVMGVFNPTDGQYHWLSVTAVPQFRAGETIPYQVFTTYDDITALRLSHGRLRRLNRMLRMLSACNQALVHALDEVAFMHTICSDIVHIGGYRMAWAGFATDDAERSVRPAAHAGHEAGFLSAVGTRWGFVSPGQGPGGSAMAVSEPTIARDIAADPQCAAWRAEALARGYRSAIELPLAEGQAVLGVLNIYSSEPDGFDDEEVGLLRELAGDLSYGIAVLRMSAARKRAEEALKATQFAVDHAAGAIFWIGEDARFQYANDAACRLTGYALPELLRTNLREIDIDFPWERWPEFWETCRTQNLPAVETRLRTKDGRMVATEVTVSHFNYADREYNFAYMQDITERKAAEERIRQLANYDTLTSLPNRMLLTDRLEQALAWGQRYGHSVAVLFVDLDKFKRVNDSLGHAAGDELLKTAAARLQGCVRETDTVARLGGDEFVLVVLEGNGGDGFQMVIRRILESFANPVRLAGRELSVTCSIGVSLFPRDGETADALLRTADAAMYQAKDKGRNTSQEYSAELCSRLSERLSLETALRNALIKPQFLLHYQPQVDLRSGQMVGVEVLVRWNCPVKHWQMPASFIPVAEETGLIVQLGEWVMRTACIQHRVWLEAGLRPIKMAVNVSALQFRHDKFLHQVAAILRDTGVSPEHLEIELTESMLVQDHEATIGTMKQLKAMGVSISLDDFGTGYSSLNYLKRLPIDALKIDQSFIRDITSDPDSFVIASAIIAMAHSMKLRVIAEGVETAGQLARLRENHCDQMQGYYFARPVPADEIVGLWRDGKTLPPVENGADDKQGTVLLVDDEVGVLSALRRLLRRDGYRILTADSAKVAFELLALNPVQVVVADHRMPEMNGTEFLYRIKELYPGAVRIMLSGYTELSSVTEAVNRGAIAKYISKPWNDNELRECVRDGFRLAKSTASRYAN